MKNRKKEKHFTDKGNQFYRRRFSEYKIHFFLPSFLSLFFLPCFSSNTHPFDSDLCYEFILKFHGTRYGGVESRTPQQNNSAKHIRFQQCEKNLSNAEWFTH